MSRVRIACIALMAALVAPPAFAIDVPRYADEAAAAGIDHRYTGGWEFFVGGGVAAFDCSGDLKPDLYLAGGAGPAALYRNATPTGGALRFSRVEDDPTALDQVTGAYPLDIDADGLQDLVVLRVGENVLFRGLGGCRFERANEALAFDGGEEWTTGFSAVWEAGHALPTLAFGNYVDRDEPGSPFGTCHDTFLYRPEGDRYGERIALEPGWCSLSVLFSDWNRDGVPDLRISNDRQYYRGGREQLWLVPPGERPRQFTEAEGWRQLKIWGMGIASQDIDGDGYPEYYLTSMTDNHLQALAEPGRGFQQTLRPSYQDVAYAHGVTATRPYVGGETMPSTAWHAEFADVNNDSFIDLFVTKGNVEGMIDFAKKDPNNLLLGNADGSFFEGAPAAGIVTFPRHRGAAVVDLNLDGLLDIVVVNRDAPAELWRNLGARAEPPLRPMGNWIQVRLSQPGGNRDGICAWIEVRAGAHIWRREVTVGGGHASGHSGWVHLGVGTAERVEVRAQWPDGTWGPWLRTFANQFVLVRRDNDRPLVWYPPPPEG